MAWPSISTPSSVSETLIKRQFLAESDGGYRLSRAIGTAAKRDFTLTWDAMTSADKATLISAITSDMGSTFSWTHPTTAASYTVRYLEDQISFQPITKAGTLWSVTIKLGEA